MNAVQHLALNCADRLAQEAFYCEQFGFQRARVFRRGEPGEFIMLRLGSCCLELFGGGPADAKGGEQPIGFKHLAFEVPSLEDQIAKLAAAGITCDPIIDCDHVSPGLRVVFFRDPEGNILELMQNWADEPDA